MSSYATKKWFFPEFYVKKKIQYIFTILACIGMILGKDKLKSDDCFFFILQNDEFKMYFSL